MDSNREMESLDEYDWTVSSIKIRKEMIEDLEEDKIKLEEAKKDMEAVFSIKKKSLVEQSNLEYNMLIIGHLIRQLNKEQREAANLIAGLKQLGKEKLMMARLKISIGLAGFFLGVATVALL